MSDTDDRCWSGRWKGDGSMQCKNKATWATPPRLLEFCKLPFQWCDTHKKSGDVRITEKEQADE